MEQLLTVEDVCEILQLPKETIRRYLRRGELRGIRIGKHWRIKREELEAFVAERERDILIV